MRLFFVLWRTAAVAWRRAGAVFVGLALVVSGMHARQPQLLAASEHERSELEGLRAAAMNRAEAAQGQAA
jgi:hypothetical protein